MVVFWKVILLGLTIPLGFIHNSVSAQDQPPLNVVVSWSILEEMVKQIGKANVDVSSLVPRGVDLHGFKMTPRDHIRLRQSEWIIWLGLGLETWLEPALRGVSKEKQLQLGEHLSRLIPLHKKKTFSHVQQYDPHFWQSVLMMIQTVEIVAEALAKKQPAQATIYRQNAKQYIQQLKQLNESINQQLGFIPASERILVTSHQAFAYFGRAYHFKTLAPHGLSHHIRPTPKRLQKLVKTLQRQKVKVLFLETTSNPALLNQIAKEAGVAIKGKLLTDNLAPKGQPGATYESFMQTNVQKIANGFRNVQP